MKGSEMKNSFLQYYDRVTNFSAPGYEVNEIELFLNNAQDEFIRTILYGERNQPPILPGNNRIEADLYPIVHTYPITNASDIINGKWTNDRYIKIHDITDYPYQYFVDLLVNYARTNPTVTSKQSFISCDVISEQDAHRFAYIPGINKPHFIKPVCWFVNYGTVSERHIHFMIDAYSTIHTAPVDEGYALLTYTMPPTKITIDPDLADFDGSYDADSMSLPIHTHQKIVDIAVRQALQALQDPRYQTKVMEEQIKSE